MKTISKQLLIFGLFIGFCGFFSCHVYAQKGRILGILLADTDAPQTGKGHALNAERIAAELDTAAAFAFAEKKIIRLKTKDLTLVNLQNAFSELNITENDFLLFYFSGSEYIGRAGRGSDVHFLQLRDTAVSLLDIHQNLSAKKPRFLFVLADLCNQFFDKGNFAFKPEAANRERYISLFTQAKGKIYAVNHIPRQQTDVFVTGNGTAFTNALIQAIHELINPQAKWETVMARARFFAVKSSNGNQNPLSDIQVTQDIKGGTYNFHSEDKISAKDVKFNPQVNEESKKSGSSAASSSAKDLGTEVPAYEAEEKLAEISPENPESMRQGTLQRVEQLQNSLSALVSASDELMLEKILSMFKDQNRMVEISHLQRGKSRAKPKRYLGRLIDSGKGQSLQINWYKPTEISEMQDDGEGGFKAYATVYQEFKRFSKKGALLYGDRTSKKIEIFIKKIGANWKIMLGNIEVLETLPLPGE